MNDQRPRHSGRHLQARPRGHAAVLRVTIALAGAGLVLAIAAVGTAVGSVRAGSGAGRISVWGLELSYPAVNTAAGITLILAALGSAALERAVRAAWRHWCAHRRFLTKMEVVGDLVRHSGVTVVAGERPEAFCAGFLSPRVYISRAAVDALAPDELHAVLAHERCHQRARDPLRIACGHILAHAVFFVPVLRLLRDRYADLAEVDADAAAVRASAGRPHALASALLVLHDAQPDGLGVSASRVDALLGEPDGWRMSWRLLAASVSTLLTAAAAIWVASPRASMAATFNIPLASSAPCALLVLILLGPATLAAPKLPAGQGIVYLLRYVVVWFLSLSHPRREEI